MVNQPEKNIRNYLQQIAIHSEQEQWELIIANCQQIIDYCQQQLSLNKTYQQNSYTQSSSLNFLQNPQDTATKMYAVQGNLLHSQRKTIEAIKNYQKAINSQPNSPVLWNKLGELYNQQEQWQKAIAAYQKEIEIDPNSLVAHRQLSQIFNRIGNKVLAADYLYRAFTLQPSQVSVSDYYNLGNFLLQQNKIDRATICFRKCIKLQPNSLKAYLGLGNALIADNKLNEAKEIYLQLIQNNPQKAELHFSLAKVFTIQKQWQEAITYYKKAIELKPNFWEAYLYISEAAIQNKQWAEVIAACNHALTIRSDVFGVYHNLGYASLKLELWSDSETALRQALKLNPLVPWTQVHLGEALSAQGQWSEAIEFFLRAIELDSNLSGIYKQLGIALRQDILACGDSEVYCDRLRQTIPFKPQNRTLAFYCQIAQHLKECRQYHGAILFYHLAFKLQPQDKSISNKLQQVRQQQEQLELKVADYRKNMREHPKSPGNYSQLANIFADQGQSEQAIALNRQASVLQGWYLALESRNYQFQYDWFTHNIPIWQKQLRAWTNKAIDILEIGSFEGMATCWLLDHILTHPDAHITCIDLYFQDNFDLNIIQTKAEKKVTKLSGNSHAILPTLFPDTYDIIYIDGCHLADYVKQDAELSWSLLKSGGLLIFDDYEHKIDGPPEQQTKVGINAFLNSIPQQYKVIHQGYQLLIQKI